MAEAINAQNIDAYLLYLSNKLQLQLPVSYSNSGAFTGKSNSEIAEALVGLYERLGMPNQAGWSFEDAFLKEAPQSIVTKVPPSSIPDITAGAYSYYPVAPGIGRLNFKPFLYWAEERLKRSLDLFGISAWDNYSDEAVRQSLPGIYRAANIPPDEAKQLELGFLAVYHQKVAPVPVQMPVSARPQQQAQSVVSKTQSTTTNVHSAGTRRFRRWLIPSVLLLAVGIAGIWMISKYNAFQSLPSVYALTNNIALRKEASDTSPVLGRMDIYGQYLDNKGIRQASAYRLKLSTSELTNGFYKATSSSDFWNFLAGNDSVLYVHTKYVTTDKTLYDKYNDDLSNLKNDYNELDKLGFIYRQLIGRAVLKNSEGMVLKIASSCKPSPRLSRVAPLSIGKYRNRATGELDVMIQATDGYCYALRGAENELAPSITPIMVMYGTITEPMKSGGMITKTGNGNTIRFEYCNDGQVFFSQPPYTLFMPLPARSPDPVPAPDDDVITDPAADTASAF